MMWKSLCIYMLVIGMVLLATTVDSIKLVKKAETEKNLNASYNCFTAPSTPGDRRKDKTKLSIISYNAEWLFLDASQCPGTGCPWSNRAEAERHLADIALIIQATDADIVAFQEAQDCDVLQNVARLIPDGGYNFYLVRGTDTATGQNVGLLTRVDPIQNLMRTESRYNYPVPGNNCNYGSSGDTGVSKHFYTRFSIPGAFTILMVNVHFLAFPTQSDRCATREAQAMVIQGLINSTALPTDEVIILGDFNDYDGVVPDKNNDMPNSRVLQFLKNSRTPQLSTMASSVSQPNRYSSWYDMNGDCRVTDNELTTIDHILYSSNLASRVTNAAYEHGLYVGSCTSYFSDHWPVKVTFRT